FDAALHQFGARHHALERVGDRELAVVVGMASDSSRAANLAQRVADRFNATPDSGRHAAAIGVAEDDPGRAGPRGREADLGRVLGVTYEAVEEALGVEDHLAT